MQLHVSGSDDLSKSLPGNFELLFCDFASCTLSLQQRRFRRIIVCHSALVGCLWDVCGRSSETLFGSLDSVRNGRVASLHGILHHFVEGR